MTAPDAAPVHERVVWQGLDCHELRLPEGDRVLVSEYGGQVLSWVTRGRERLYLSPLATLDGRAAIRGGIPVCWPQFSDRGPLTRHGWVRQSRWRFVRVLLEPCAPCVVMDVLPADVRPPGSDSAWGGDCRLEICVMIVPGCLEVTLTIFNQGGETLAFTGALHTYLALDDAEVATVAGWPEVSARQGWDSVKGVPCHVEPGLALCGEIDRILPAASGPLHVVDGDHQLFIEQAGWADVVVWNPGASKCAAMSDMPGGGERRMACIEAAQACSPALVSPGGVWTGSQRLAV